MSFKDKVLQYSGRALCCDILTKFVLILYGIYIDIKIIICYIGINNILRNIKELNEMNNI